MRRAARVDANQAEIIRAFRAMGASVWVIGLPVDLLVGYAGITALVECKAKKGRYTGLQIEFMESWRGGAVSTIRDVDGAVRLIQTMRASAAVCSDSNSIAPF